MCSSIISYSSLTKCVRMFTSDGWLNFFEDFCVSGSDAGPLLVSANDHCLKVGGFPVLQVILGWPQFNACFFGQNISDVPH